MARLHIQTIHSNGEKWIQSIQAPQWGFFEGGEASLHGNSGAWQLSHKRSHFLKLEEAPKLPCKGRIQPEVKACPRGGCEHPPAPGFPSVAGSQIPGVDAVGTPRGTRGVPSISRGGFGAHAQGRASGERACPVPWCGRGRHQSNSERCPGELGTRKENPQASPQCDPQPFREPAAGCSPNKPLQREAGGR